MNIESKNQKQEMILKNIFIFSVVYLVQSCYCDNEGYFTVVASKLMRQNKPYRVSIHHKNYADEKILQIGLKNDKFNDYKNISFVNDGDKEIIFYVNKKDFVFF